MSAWSAEVLIPLAIPCDYLTMAMAKDYQSDSEHAVVMHYDNDCRHLSLDQPQFDRRNRFDLPVMAQAAQASKSSVHAIVWLIGAAISKF
jgi:hypothetical protein